MSFGPGDHVLAALAAGGAGLVNALAGGGTLISFPTLVGLGLPKVEANITNTVALCPGYVGGTYSQRAVLRTDGPRVGRLSVAAALGGLAGSILLVVSDESLFDRLVPWLIVTACVLLACQQGLRSWLARRDIRHRDGVGFVALASTFAVSIYGGYFGAGFGIMTLAVLGVLYDDALPRLTAIKQLVALVVNLVAAAFFVGTGDVHWNFVAVMAPASLLGGLLGGRLVDIVRPGLLRPFVVSYGLVLAVYYLLR